MPTTFADGVLVGVAAVVTNTGLTQPAFRLEGDERRLRLYDDQGREFFRTEGPQRRIQMYDEQSKQVVEINDGGNLFLGGIGSTNLPGQIQMYNNQGQTSIHLSGQSGTYAVVGIGSSGSPGALQLRNRSGQQTLFLDGEKGDITLNNADCAEDFPVSASMGVEPGTVVVLDDDGRLTPCLEPYDSRVVGIISGGQGEGAGIVLGRGKVKPPCAPVALVGTVYCKVTTEYGPIKTGALLTTSPVPGHAMAADDPVKSHGTVIGKALRKLVKGTGMVPVLVMLR